MAVHTPHVRWGSREVEWTWVPEGTSEMTATARRMLAEGLGMLGFVFIAGSAIAINDVSEIGTLAMAFATAAGYALMVALAHPISGGHINPAITVGMVFGRRMPPSVALLYIGAQFAGAVLGALLLNLIYDDILSDASRTASLAFHEDMSFWTGALLEGILAFVLVVVYFRYFVDPRGDRSLGAGALGLVVLFSFLVAFSLTGAALNVARVFGTALVANEWTDFWAYVVALLGGAAAGLVYEYVFTSPEEDSQHTSG